MRASRVTIRQRCGDILIVLSLGALAMAAMSLLAGGIALRAGPLAIASRTPARAFYAAVVLTAAARLVLGAAGFSGWIVRIAGPQERRAGRLVAVTAAAVFIVTAAWNTRAVGGSDSSCYALQAEAFARGDAFVAAGPPGVDLSLPPAAFAPAGFLPAPGRPGRAVPICAAGLALLMAPLTRVNRELIFLVVPATAAAAIWLTFALGRRVMAPAGAACAAVLFACSPILLYQAVQPMSDVPATALSLAAFVAATGVSRRSAVVCGFCYAAAVLTRPNLAILALPLIWIAEKMDLSPFPAAGKRGQVHFSGGGKGDRSIFRGAWFAAGAAPIALVMLALNAARYGGALASGYGDANALFAASHLAPNLARYPRWLVQTETPFVLLALAAPWTMRREPDRRRLAAAALIAVAAMVCTYLAYTVFDDWWYLRFLLPALPLLLVLAVAALFDLTRRAPANTGRAVAIFICALLAGYAIDTAFARRVFDLQRLEARFAATGRYVSAALPPDAVVLAGQDSGSVVFHGRRAMLMWDQLPPSGLTPLIEQLERSGRPVFLALEESEEPAFRQRFAGDAYGALAWPPIAQTRTATRVRVYRAADRIRFAAGDTWSVQYVR